MTTLNETYVNSLKINRLTKTQLNNATDLSPSEAYWEDPEFVGGKLLETTADGDIVESSQTIPTKTSDLTNDSGFLTGITSSDVTTALGYTPYDDSNPDGYITGITSAMVTTALGYTPYNSSNPSGYISGITSAMVTTALGYTPYDASNPNGYTSNTGTVTSVNNVSPTNGNVTLSIPSDTSDLTNGAGYITSSALSGYQTTSNLVTSVSSASTDSQYPSAKLFYDTCGDIETLINAL